MKAFDIKLAKAGHKVQTRDGRPARIVCYDLKMSIDTSCMLVLVEDANREYPYKYTLGGSCMEYDKKDLDLVMIPEIKEGWINIYKNNYSNTLASTSENIYKTEHEALANRRTEDYITTIKIEFEV